MRKVTEAIWVFLLAMAATAVYSGEIVVAQVAPFSGGIASYSNDTFLGAFVYFEALNVRGGVNGNRLRFVKRDDQMVPEETVRLFEEVAKTEKPVAFLYPVGPKGIAELLRQTVPQKLRIPVLGTIPAIDRLRVPTNPYMFYLDRGNEAEQVKLVEHMAALGFKRIGIVHWNDTGAQSGIAVIEREAKNRGLTVVSKQPVESGTDKVLPAAAALNNVSLHAVIVILPVHATGALVKAMRSAGNFTPVYGASYTESSLLAKFAGEEYARGVGVSQVVPNPFSRSTPLTKEYQDNMNRYAPGTRLSTVSLQGYVAAKIVGEAIRRAGPNPDGTAVQKALERMRELDLGGLMVNFTPEQHVGVDFIDIGVVGRDGRLRY